MKDNKTEAQRYMERCLLGETTNNQAPAESSTLDGPAFVRQMEQTTRNFRRHNITFQVDLGHPGSMLKRETPHDGTVIECSWLQANQVHQLWPLKLLKVTSESTADFVSASPTLHDYVPKHLPMPPYEMPRLTPAGRAMLATSSRGGEREG